jgi:hypothetical protein
MLAGEGETVTVGVVFTTAVMVYVAKATALCVKPLAVAMASMVSVADTVIAAPL